MNLSLQLYCFLLILCAYFTIFNISAFNSQKPIFLIFFFAIIINSISAKLILLINLRISLKSLLILFLITADPIFFVTINLVLIILLSLLSFRLIYIIKYFLLIYMPFLNNFFISSSFFMLSRIMFLLPRLLS